MAAAGVMLLPSERRWWPVAPLLLLQGLYTRLRTAELPPAASPRGRAGSGEPALRLVGLGDSIIAGIGVSDQQQALLGQVAGRIAQRSGRAVEWVAIGRAGFTARDVREQLLATACAERPQLVVLSVGVNDAVQGREPAAFKDDLRAIVDGLAGSRGGPAIVIAGVPPLDQFPALPWPLATLLGNRARRLAAAATSLVGYRGVRVVVFPATMASRRFSGDGFHPGPAGCADWARWVADGFPQAPD